MVTKKGNKVVVSFELNDGTEWLLRVRSIIRMVQCVDEQLMNKDEIYFALSVVEDMLPDEDCAHDLWRMLKEKAE